MSRFSLTTVSAPVSLDSARTTLPRDPDSIVTRDDLLALVASVLRSVDGLSGRDALRRAGKVLSAWCASRTDARFVGSSWQRDIRSLSRALLALGTGRVGPRWTTPFRIFNLSGNVKLPFAAFSTLPIATCPGAGECARWCYSFTAWRYPAAFARQLQNTLLLWFAPELIRTAFLALPVGVTLRLYVDGDFDSAATVSFWMDALAARPDLSAYGYSKSWDLLEAHGRAHGFPSNYVLNLSTGGRATVSVDAMRALPITRGVFATVPTDYKPAGHKTGKVGFERYKDRAYHKSVLAAARNMGITGPLFSCPGTCGTCTAKRHACGDAERFAGITIVNGAH